MKQKLADYLNAQADKLKAEQRAKRVAKQPKRLTLSVTAKCSDLFNAALHGDAIVGTVRYDGYVPAWFPNPNVEHFGDYVELRIDVATGKILNWRKPSKAQLEKTFNCKHL
jgi:hypothetical protein